MIRAAMWGLGAKARFGENEARLMAIDMGFIEVNFSGRGKVCSKNYPVQQQLWRQQQKREDMPALSASGTKGPEFIAS